MLRLRCGSARAALLALEAQVRRHLRLAVALVDDVDAVVLAVRAGDAEHHRRPPPHAELLLRQLALEDERPLAHHEVDALPLLHAVQEDLERPLHIGRKSDERSPARPVAHVHRMPATVRPKPLVIVGALVVPLVATATALAGSGGFTPFTPESPNAHAIKQSFLFISAFVFAIFLLVEILLVAFVIRYRRR